MAQDSFFGAKADANQFGRRVFLPGLTSRFVVFAHPILSLMPGVPRRIRKPRSGFRRFVAKRLKLELNSYCSSTDAGLVFQL
jgi:hypothetical protein